MCFSLGWEASATIYVESYYLVDLSNGSIKYIFEKPALTGRIARWQMLLSKYDIEYRTQKAIKSSVLAEYLAHQPVEDDQSVEFDFPNEDVMYLKMKDYDELLPEEGSYLESRWGMVFDGAVNAYGKGIGVCNTVN